MNSNTKTVLITGASRGIGKAAAECFAKAGYRLILTCSNSINDLKLFADELRKQYQVSCEVFRTDMG